MPHCRVGSSARDGASEAATAKTPAETPVDHAPASDANRPGCPSPPPRFWEWIPANSVLWRSPSPSLTGLIWLIRICLPQRRRRGCSGSDASGSTPTPVSWAAGGCWAIADRGASAAARSKLPRRHRALSRVMGARAAVSTLPLPAPRSSFCRARRECPRADEHRIVPLRSGPPAERHDRRGRGSARRRARAQRAERLGRARHKRFRSDRSADPTGRPPHDGGCSAARPAVRLSDGSWS